MTESDELAAALDSAAARWPDLSRAQLIVRLALEGDRATSESDDDDRAQGRRAALRRSSGVFNGVYGPGYLEELREDWPE